MVNHHFECTRGHDFDVDDTGDKASEIALDQTRKRLGGGCDSHVRLPDGHRVQCGARVEETRS